MVPSVLGEARRPLLADAVTSRLMDNLTGGTFLAGLAILTGASNFQLALIAAVPFLAQVVQLPAVALLLRFKDRRRIVTASAGLSRALWVLVGVLVMAASLPPSLLVAVVAIGSALAVVATAAWNWWMRDLLPPDEMAQVFGQRLRGATVVSLVVMLGVGYALDAIIARGRPDLGYGALFVVGGLCGLGGIWALARTPHVPPPPSPPARQALGQVVAATRAADKRLVAALALAGVGVSFALPFAAIYLLRGLGFSLLAATVMAAISQVAYLAGLRGWVHVSARYGDRPLAAVSLGVLAASLAVWSLTGWQGGLVTLAVIGALHFLSGYALSGIELATTNLMLRSAPADNAPAYFASLSVLRAGAAGAGVLASGWLWDTLGRGVLWSTHLPWVGTWELRGFQVLCMVSILPCLWGVYALARLREADQASIVTVVRAMRREVNQMSSIAGMRAFIHAVSYSVEFMAAPFASRMPDEDLQDPSA